MTAQEIQEKYPNPKKAGEGGFGDYCVGGAVCRAIDYGLGYSFPQADIIAGALRKLNPALSNAFDLASCIIKANDRGDFKAAYGYVEQALS